MMDKTYSVEMVLVAFFIATILILLGAIARSNIKVLNKLHFPACVIGGIIGLILGPQLLGGNIAKAIGMKSEIKEIYYIWKSFPSYLISLVFATLMMGKSFPPIQKVWRSTYPQVMVGYAMALAQYIVGIVLCLWILTPLMGTNPLSSALIAIGFQGGYGTAAGLNEVYTKFGFTTGYDMAIGMATAGKICAIVVGIALINFAVRFNKMKCPDQNRREFLRMAVPYALAESEYKKQQEEQHMSADTLILHFGVLCIAVAIGWCIREVLLGIEWLFIASPDKSIMQFVPLFPMALIGGGVLQYLLGVFKLEHTINGKHLHSLSHSFLDLLIVVATATISVEVILNHWQSLTILVIGGVLSNLFVLLFIALYFYKDSHWVRGLGDFAHATGSTTTGLLMMKIVDPSDATGARKDFNYKQPFYEPIIGGGIFTSIAIPLFYIFGLSKSLMVLSILFAIILLVGIITLGIRKARKS